MEIKGGILKPFHVRIWRILLDSRGGLFAAASSTRLRFADEFRFSGALRARVAPRNGKPTGMHKHRARWPAVFMCSSDARSRPWAPYTCALASTNPAYCKYRRSERPCRVRGL